MQHDDSAMQNFCAAMQKILCRNAAFFYAAMQHFFMPRCSIFFCDAAFFVLQCSIFFSAMQKLN